MAVGGSDYGNVARGQIGQGFAQGVESGLVQYNKGVDRKITQANKYMETVLIPNLQRLNRPLDPPKPEDGPEAMQEYLRARQSQSEQLGQIKGKIGEVLTITQSPFKADDIMGMYFDPANAIPAEAIAERQRNLGIYRTQYTQNAQYQQQLSQIDPVKSPGEYKTVWDSYQTWLNSSGFRDSYRLQNGTEYVEFETLEAATARVNDQLTSSDRNYI